MIITSCLPAVHVLIKGVGLVSWRCMNMASEPSPRWGHSSVAVEGQFYVYGGRTKDFWTERSSLRSTVHLFSPGVESWQERRPKGTSPSGLVYGACTSIGHHAYYYGGSDGTESHGFLHQLNTVTLRWDKLSTSGPMRKHGCGMISHDDQLLLFGGDGIQSGYNQPGAEFVKDTRFTDGSGLTNELHTFCLKRGEMQ